MEKEREVAIKMLEDIDNKLNEWGIKVCLPDEKEESELEGNYASIYGTTWFELENILTEHLSSLDEDFKKKIYNEKEIDLQIDNAEGYIMDYLGLSKNSSDDDFKNAASVHGFKDFESMMDTIVVEVASRYIYNYDSSLSEKEQYRTIIKEIFKECYFVGEKQ